MSSSTLRWHWYFSIEPSFPVSYHQQTWIDDFDIRRGGVGMYDPGAGDYHDDSLSGDIIGAEGG